MIVDLARPDAARFMIAPGQSGNPLSPHWGDLLRPWRDVRYRHLRRRHERRRADPGAAVSKGDAELPVTLADIRMAAAAIADEVMHTPTVPAPALGALAGAELFLKLETLHLTGSFKERGALKLESWRGGTACAASSRCRPEITLRAWPITRSASALRRRSSCRRTRLSPRSSGRATRRRGRAGRCRRRRARRRAAEIVSARGLVLIHPYDDPIIIAGQGTVGLELMSDAPASTR